MIHPIFVLGKQRSGTTWLANQLCAHSAIAGVQHEHHHGIHESAYFSHVYGRYGDLKYKSNFVEFVEAMAESDTIRILGFDKEFLYSLWPTTYEAFFTTLMREHAKRNSAKFWLEKSPEHTLLAYDLEKLYPDAKFVAVIRDVHDVLDSALSRYKVESLGFRRLRLARVALNWVRYKCLVEDFARRNNSVLILSYTNLKGETEQSCRQVCEFLGLEFERGMLLNRYRANTTFVEGRTRGQLVSMSERKFVDGVVRLTQVLPRSFFGVLGRKRLKHKERTPLPHWFYSMYPNAMSNNQDAFGE